MPLASVFAWRRYPRRESRSRALMLRVVNSSAHPPAGVPPAINRVVKGARTSLSALSAQREFFVSVGNSTGEAGSESIEITHDFRPDPLSHRNRDPIPNHSISIIITANKTKRVRHTLESRVLANRIRPHAMRKPLVRNQSCTQVLSIVCNAGRRDVAALRITYDRPISICSSQTPTDIIRNVRRRIRLKYLSQSHGSFGSGLAPEEVPPTTNDD